MTKRNAGAGPVLIPDLETVVDPSLPVPEKAKKGDADPFPPIPCHEVVVLGAALLDAFGRLRHLWVVGEGQGERGMLAALVTFLNEQLAKRSALTIVGFSSRGFDLPVIVARCLRYVLAFPWYYAQRDVRYRYSTEGHFDLMDFLVDHGASRAYSLDLAAKLIGMPRNAREPHRGAGAIVRSRKRTPTSSGRSRPPRLDQVSRPSARRFSIILRDLKKKPVENPMSHRAVQAL